MGKAVTFKEQLKALCTGAGVFAMSGGISAANHFGLTFPNWAWALYGVAMIALILICGTTTLQIAWLSLRRRRVSVLAIILMCFGALILAGGIILAAKQWVPESKKADIARPAAGMSIRPPAVADAPKITMRTTYDKFEADNAPILNQNFLFDWQSNDGVFAIIAFDKPTKTSSISMLIEGERPVFPIAKLYANKITPLVEEIAKQGPLKSFSVPEREPFMFSDVKFSGRVMLYYEGDMSLREQADLDDLYKNNGLAVEFRGPKYIASIGN